MGNIRIKHECEIEKSVPRIAVWHHEACRVMTNGDGEGLIILSHPHTNNGFLFLHNIRYRILLLNRLQEVLESAEMRHDMMTPL